MKPIDLRSDTVTRPSPAMRRAMAEADVGDDVYGEDPTVRTLEERAAALAGHEDALFVPSGTMANQLALGVHVRAGDEVIAEAGAHCINAESGAMSALWGAQPRPIPTDGGIFTAAQVLEAARPPSDFTPRSRLLCVENTSNKGCGAVWPLAQVREVSAAARGRGLCVHLDGARLFNASVASGVAVAEYGRLADTVSLCFSKGLGAPVGSVLCGSRDLLREARRLRKRLGGGMRQAGILAAAALYALDHNVRRLSDDHAHAQRLKAGLARIPGLEVHPHADTNMVFVKFPQLASEALRRLREAGVLGGPEAMRSPHTVRFVCHLDVSADDIERVLERVASAVAPSSGP